MHSAATYLHVQPGGELPRWHVDTPFRCVLIVEADVSMDWRLAMSAWLVEAGCRYMLAWGQDCSLWDDTVDLANLARFDFDGMPEDERVMTTWHDGETLQETFWFAKELANHPTVALRDTLLLHVALRASETEMLAAFKNAKD